MRRGWRRWLLATFWTDAWDGMRRRWGVRVALGCDAACDEGGFRVGWDASEQRARRQSERGGALRCLRSVRMPVALRCGLVAQRCLRSIATPATSCVAAG
eukprot:350458-Chlamydomonas_euryale.AAC.1